MLREDNVQDILANASRRERADQNVGVEGRPSRHVSEDVLIGEVSSCLREGHHPLA